MNFLRDPAVAFVLSIGLATSSFAAVADDPVLRVEQISGEVQIDQLGETRLLKLGDELHDRDVVRVADDAYIALRFTQQGALELGPGTALAIERLPVSAEGSDLRSILSLWKGYLHVVWKHPPNTRWPLFVYFGGQRSSLVDGEYFFERLGTRLRSCVAAGRLAVTSIAGDAPETLRPSACYEIAQGGVLKTEPRALESWVAVRQSFRLNPDPSKPVHAFPSPEPEPAADEPADEPETPPLPVLPPPPPPPPLTTVYAAPPSSSSKPSTPVTPKSQTALVFTAKKQAPVPSSPPATSPAPSPASAAAPSPAPAPSPAAAPRSAAASPAAPAPVIAAATPPQPASAAPAEAGAGWTILIGSYADPQNAAQIQQKLIAAGYMPFLRVKNIDGRIWNSVQIRGYATREAAEAKAGDIGTRLGLPNLRILQLP